MVRSDIPLSERLEDLRSVATVRQLVKEGRIRQIREDGEATQAAIAEVVGCTPSAISQYEAGLRMPSGDRARRLAAALAALPRSVGS